MQVVQFPKSWVKEDGSQGEDFLRVSKMNDAWY